ncbi:MAG: GNAT family N-acetyltransferase [Sphingosinicella sp.]|nr:GNAT family N-acetyltransferase [Sphingosinicella sp.]
MTSIGIPILETERLRLRAPAAHDLEASTAMWSNPQVVEHIGGVSFTREDVWSRILRYRGLWAMLGYGFWSVEDKSTGRFVGDVGFGDFHRDLTPSIEGVPEMGWVLDPWCHGKGFASEAVTRAMEWGRAHLEAPEYACIINPENTPSIRVAQKAGFVQAVETVYKNRPTLIFRHTARAP